MRAEGAPAARSLRGCVWDGDRLWPEARVDIGGGGIVLAFYPEAHAAGGAPAATVERCDGLLIPGLINAHTHLEIGPAQTAAGLGLPGWVRAMRAAAAVGAAAASAAARAARDLGTAFVVDHSNTGLAEAAARAAGLDGLFLQEILGIGRRDLEGLDGSSGARLTPHAPYSCHPDLIRACAARAARLGHRWSIHFDEDPAEAEFLLTGGGAWADYLRALGRDLAAFPVPGRAPTAYLGGLGVLDGGALLVHACCTGPEELAVIAASGAAVALCPRSNLHVSGRLPDVAAMLAADIPMLIGTDSLAGAPDLDPLAEAALLLARVPALTGAEALRMLTGAAGRALGVPAGRLAAGQAPGIVELAGRPEAGADPLRGLLGGARLARRWVVEPGRDAGVG